MIEAANRAPPCTTPAVDCVGYHHFVMQPTEMLYACWSNPSPSEHASQLNLIADYASLLTTAGLPEADAWQEAE
jgi:hypothetical protein